MASASYSNGGIPRRQAVPLMGMINFGPAIRQGPGSNPGPVGPIAQPSGTSQPPFHPTPPQAGPVSPRLPPGDPMDTTDDYPGFGQLGSPHAAFCYQQIIYPAIVVAFGPLPITEIPPWAFYPKPWVVPVAYRTPSSVAPQLTAAAATIISSTTTNQAASSRPSTSSYRSRF